MKHVIKAIVYTAIPICMLLVIIYYAGILFRPIRTDSSFNAINTFHSLPEDTVEVMIYGSSHAQIGLNVMEMYEKYGIGAYNYGNQWQHINTTLLFIQDSLRTQSPKVILVETYHVNGVLMDMDMDGEIYYTKAIPFSEAKSKYLKQCFGNKIERYLSYYMPFIAFHGNWNKLKADNLSRNSDHTDFYESMGYWRYKDETFQAHIDDYRTYKQKELSEEVIETLNEIVQVCEENNIEIVFYTAPYEAEYSYFSAMEKYAEDHGCAYINLFAKMDEMGIDCSTDFCDKNHMTISGATKVADYLGKYIVENYDVTDMRNVERNLWEREN